MRKMSGIAGAVPILVAGLLFPAPAQAGERFAVQLSDTQNFEDLPGTFTSNIPGCPTGESFTLRGMAQFHGDGGVFRGTRMFVCDSGIGSVTANLSARFGEDGSVGTWSLVGGSGAFSGVHGAGKLVGTPVTDGIRDDYTGTVTVTGT